MVGLKDFWRTPTRSRPTTSPTSSPYFCRTASGHFSEAYAQPGLPVADGAENPARVVEITHQQLLEMPRQSRSRSSPRIQGWSATLLAGVPMREIRDLVRPAANAKWVVFYLFADGPVGGRYYDCHPIASTYHDPTIPALRDERRPTQRVPRLDPAAQRGRTRLQTGQGIEAIEFESFEGVSARLGGWQRRPGVLRLPDADLLRGGDREKRT